MVRAAPRFAAALRLRHPRPASFRRSQECARHCQALLAIAAARYGEDPPHSEDGGGDPRSARMSGWEFWIDRGGTFTDVVARRPDGALLTRKLLSENPERYRDAAIAGIREILGVAKDAPIPAEEIDAVKM